MDQSSIKILCIGNSFSEDTTAYVAQIASSIGFSKVLVANLYVGGCPIAKHYENWREDLPCYRYDRNDGTGWQRTTDVKISAAIREEEWDWISIQHGSSYGACYTDEACYADLPALLREVKQLAGEKTKIAFNMAWVGEPTRDRPEMLLFDRDQKRYYEALCAVTQRVVAPTAGLDLVCPTGTAVQNARTSSLNGQLDRDGFHLSLAHGRYLAGLTFLRALTGADISRVLWMPEGVSEAQRRLMVRAALCAVETPFAVTPIG